MRMEVFEVWTGESVQQRINLVWPNIGYVSAVFKDYTAFCLYYILATQCTSGEVVVLRTYYALALVSYYNFSKLLDAVGLLWVYALYP